MSLFVTGRQKVYQVVLIQAHDVLGINQSAGRQFLPALWSARLQTWLMAEIEPAP